MKVSILVITYNHEAFIQQALESILLQKDCPEYEIIIADDHSSDGTIAIARELLQTNRNVVFAANEINLGITKNYQRAFKLCTGEYIMILEGDDYWIDPYKVNKVVHFLDQHPFCGMCAHPFYKQQDDLSIFTKMPVNSTEPYEFFDCKDLILDSSIISNFSTCSYRKSVLEKISLKTYDVISYDWMINMSVAQFGLIGRINSLMSVYRISASGSWSKMSEKEQLNEMINIIPVYDEILEHKYTSYFNIKKGILMSQLTPPEKKTAVLNDLAGYLPPIIIKAAKLFIPRKLVERR